MKSLIAGLSMMAVSLWGVFSFAQQQPRYPVDPQTKLGYRGQAETGRRT